MPRMARIDLIGYPHHVGQRGQNRQAIFAGVAAYERYLATLHGYKSEYRTPMMGWGLIANHMHLLLVPEDREGLGKLMKRIPGRQTRHHNRLERRSGTPWKGRDQRWGCRVILICASGVVTSNLIRAGACGRHAEWVSMVELPTTTSIRGRDVAR